MDQRLAHANKALGFAAEIAIERNKIPEMVKAFRDVRDARNADAALNTAVLRAWPEQTVAKQLMYIGAALVGSSGVSATVAQLLLKTNSIGAYLVSIILGGAMFLYGLFLLWRDQGRKWSFFGNRMRVFSPHDRFWTIKKDQ